MPKITALQSETSPTNDDFLAIVDNASGTTRKVTKADLLKGQALTNLNGGTTAGVLTTDASGGVSVSSWQSFTPVISASSGAYSNALLTGRYTQVGKTVTFKVDINIINAGTASTVRFSLPVAARYISGEQTAIGYGREYAANGKSLTVYLESATHSNVFYFDNAIPNASGVKLSISGTYEAA